MPNTHDNGGSEGIQEQAVLPSMVFCYRGRAYPIPSFLTPQDTDFGKSLLMFDEPAFMTPEAEDWLRFQVSTTRGLDKASIAERLQWARDNEKLIEQIATDPLGMTI